MVACCPQRVSDKPECRASLVNAGTTLKTKKDDLSLRWSEVNEISCHLKFLAQFLNLGHLETNQISRNLFTSGLSNYVAKRVVRQCITQ